MLISREAIPAHIAIQLERQNRKVDAIEKSNHINEKNKIQEFINTKHTNIGEQQNVQLSVLCAILANPNINPHNVNENIRLASEYSGAKK